MSGPTPTIGKAGNFLTDGTGISSFTGSKVLKDFVADFLISAAAALTAANILSVEQVVAAPQLAGFAVAGALFRAAYRVVLKWATT